MADLQPVVPALGIVIPAWNEAARISPTIQAIGALRAAGWPIRGVVVADDGSTDETAQVARSEAAGLDLALEVLALPHAGKASAVRAGMLRASGSLDAEYLLMLDADNEVSVDQLGNVTWVPDRRTIYIARRVGEAGGRGAVRPTLLRRTMSLGMRTLARVLLGLGYPDTQCGFKLFPAHAVPVLFGTMRSRSWVFDAELLVIARALGLPIVEVSVVWQPQGDSRVRPSAALTSAGALVAIALRRARGRYAFARLFMADSSSGSRIAAPGIPLAGDPGAGRAVAAGGRRRQPGHQERGRDQVQDRVRDDRDDVRDRP